jgi:hypothetical protein
MSIALIAGVFTWTMVVITQMKFPKRIGAAEVDKFGFTMPFFPVANDLASPSWPGFSSSGASCSTSGMRSTSLLSGSPFCTWRTGSRRRPHSGRGLPSRAPSAAAPVYGRVSGAADCSHARPARHHQPPARDLPPISLFEELAMTIIDAKTQDAGRVIPSLRLAARVSTFRRYPNPSRPACRPYTAPPASGRRDRARWWVAVCPAAARWEWGLVSWLSSRWYGGAVS